MNPEFVLLPQIVNTVNFVVQIEYAELINDIRLWAETILMQLRAIDLFTLEVKIVMDQFVDPILGVVQNATPLASPESALLTAFISSPGQAQTRSVGLLLGVAGLIGTGVASFLYPETGYNR
jgi:hypothetical protein